MSRDTATGRGKRLDFRTDPAFQAFLPKLTPDEYRGLVDRIKAEGCQPGALTVGVINGDRILLDGHNTLAICNELKKSLPKPRELMFPNREAALRWMIQHQHARRNWTPEQRQEFVAKLRDLGASRREIAEAVGVSTATVGRALALGDNAVSSDTAKLPTCDRCRRVGKVKNCKRCADLRREHNTSASCEPECDAQTEEPLRDESGFPVPQRLLPVFEAIPLYIEAARKADSAAAALQKVEASKAYSIVDWASEAADPERRRPATDSTAMKTTSARLRRTRPAVVCRECEGEPASQDAEVCSKCSGKGFLCKDEV
jgi:hypothetical protein